MPNPAWAALWLESLQTDIFYLAACEKIGAPMSPKTEKKCWGQSMYAIMDIGSPKTIRVCHIFRFSKNP